MSAVRPVTGLIASIGICFAFAGLGSVLTATSVDSWYASLKKPAWIPPTWIFAPVWSALYLTMAVAAWLVWCRAGFAQARPALIIFGVQLLLNVGWSAIFFGLRMPGGALVEMVLLWAAIAATAWLFREYSATAAWLMVPYLVWVAYAGALNYMIWTLN